MKSFKSSAERIALIVTAGKPLRVESKRTRAAQLGLVDFRLHSVRSKQIRQIVLDRQAKEAKSDIKDYMLCHLVAMGH